MIQPTFNACQLISVMQKELISMMGRWKGGGQIPMVSWIPGSHNYAYLINICVLSFRIKQNIVVFYFFSVEKTRLIKFVKFACLIFHN